jgi:predicted phage terminase large subunit-like protein
MLPPSMLPLSLESVVRLVFRGENAGRELGNEPYITYSCKRLEKAKDNGARIVNNQPPRHMKSTAGTVGLSVWLLGLNPAEKILIVTYSAQLVADLGYRIREALRSNWFRLLYPQTRLTSDRTSVTDFATTAGGGVYLASVDGSFIGRGATAIIFDDPLDMDDAGNPEKRHKVNERFDTAILSRLNDPINGRVVINAHRLHESDLSGHVLSGGGWDHIVLPFEAPSDRVYKFAGREWHRKRSDLLRPDAFSSAEVARIKSIINPDYEALYQQLEGQSNSISISRDHFGSFTDVPKNAGILISVDPGHRSGPGHSFTVMQAWSRVGDDFLLLDQWREQADVDAAVSALKFAVRACSPALVRIEFSGYGQLLARDLQKTSRSVEIQLVPTDRRSKSARLLGHADLIQSGRIKLAQGADWRETWVSEFETFPKGPFDDQVDACTLALDFFVQGLALTKPQPRALGGVLSNSRGWIDARSLTPRGAHPHIVTRQRYGMQIFPKKRS